MKDFCPFIECPDNQNFMKQGHKGIVKLMNQTYIYIYIEHLFWPEENWPYD